MKRRTWFLPVLVAALLAISAGAFIVWGSTPLGPSQTALDALKSDSAVTVDISRDWIAFTPTGQQPQTGFIFYPGGRVDYRSYAPPLRLIADAGYQVVLVRMPLNLAVFAPGKASEVMDAFPQIQDWAVGGHSLGGAMAANFIYQNPGAARGLVLWAAYPASSNDLSGQAVAVASIFATQDGLATREKIDASIPLLPADTTWVQIEGGSHAQFGSYGLQPGDGTASITPEAQWQQTATATIGLLENIER